MLILSSHDIILLSHDILISLVTTPCDQHNFIFANENIDTPYTKRKRPKIQFRSHLTFITSLLLILAKAKILFCW